MRTWQMEYYCGFPNIRIRFTVDAETFEEAIQKGEDAISHMRRTATYSLSVPLAAQ